MKRFIAFGLLSVAFAMPTANAVVLCKSVGVPKGCVAAPGAVGVGVDPGINQPGAAGNVRVPGVGVPGVGAPGVGVVDPGINQPGAAGNIGVPGNRGGPVNRVGPR